MGRIAIGLTALGLSLGAQSIVAAEPAASPLREGPWTFTIRSSDLGALRGRLVATRGENGGLTWASRPKALEALLAPEKAALARVFLAVAPDGSLVHLDRTSLRGDRLEGRFAAAALGEFSLEATTTPEGFRGRLLARDGSPWATIEAAPLAAGAPTPVPGKALASVAEITRARYFDPRILESDAWKGFLADLGRASAAAADDVETAFAFYALKQPLRVSHYALLRRDAADAKAGAPPPPAFGLDEVKPGVARLVVRHFAGTAAEVDDAFGKIVAAKPRALVIDLRGNQGGNLSAMAVAAHLLEKPASAGTFVGAAWWKTHKAPPTAAEIAAAPPFERFDLDAFRARLAETGLVATRVPLVAPRFDGLVAVLVDGRTASACEPLVALLAQTKRAQIVGDRTAGAMLSSDEADLGDGWVLRVPVADYLTPSGARLEGRGVDPTIEADPEEALARALEWIATAK